MPELITRTARLVPYAKRPKQVPSFVTAYSYEPLPNEPGAALGNLFAVVEVLVSGRSSEEVADLVLGTLSEHYYNEASSQTEPLARFEESIKAVNRELTTYVNQGKAAWIGKLSAVVAVQTGSELHLAQTGSAEAFLYRGKSAARISGSQSVKPAAPSKTFGSIASGQLETNDRLLLATPALIHQLSLTKLKSIISETSPNSAIAEITELLRGGSSDRIAALVIEATTPELAALQVRSEEPSEIQLGSPETMVEAAKMAAAPLAQATVTTSKRATAAAKTGWQKAQPHVQTGALVARTWLQRFATGKNAPRRILIGAAIIVLAAFGLWQWHVSSVRTQQLLDRYSIDYHQYELASSAAAGGDNATARDLLTKLQSELSDLKGMPGRSQLDSRLASGAISGSQAKSVADLQALVASKMDQIEGLNHVAATTVASFKDYKNAKPTLFELNSGSLYAFDSNNNSAIYVVNIATKQVKKSAADTTKLGQVVATTLSPSGDGIYILTKKPGVWLYRFDNDNLTEQTAGLGAWEPGKAIASYGSNLYILGDDVVYKHVRTYSGYSPKSEYLSGANIAGAAGLAVDGAVYTLAKDSLKQFLSGTLKSMATVPASLNAGHTLRSTNNGNTLVASSSQTSRIALWDASKSLTFSKQYSLNNVKELFDATYDGKTKTGYALVDDRIVSFTP